MSPKMMETPLRVCVFVGGDGVCVGGHKPPAWWACNAVVKATDTFTKHREHRQDEGWHFFFASPGSALLVQLLGPHQNAPSRLICKIHHRGSNVTVDLKRKLDRGCSWILERHFVTSSTELGRTQAVLDITAPQVWTSAVTIFITLISHGHEEQHLLFPSHIK